MNDSDAKIRLLSWKEMAKVGGEWRLAIDEQDIRDTMSREGTSRVYEPRIHEVMMDRQEFARVAQQVLPSREREQILEKALELAVTELKQLQYQLSEDFVSNAALARSAAAKGANKWESSTRQVLERLEGFTRTQGPWFTGPEFQDGLRYDEVAIVGNESDAVIATVWPYGEGSSEQPLERRLQDRGDEQVGNLRLILASDDLEKRAQEGLAVLAELRRSVEAAVERCASVSRVVASVLPSVANREVRFTGKIGGIRALANGLKEFVLQDGAGNQMTAVAGGELASKVVEGKKVALEAIWEARGGFGQSVARRIESAEPEAVLSVKKDVGREL